MTTFALIGTFQVMENYGAHDWDGKGQCPEYWKAKGGHEVVAAENISVTEAANMHSDEMCKMVEALHPGNCDYYRYSLIDFELVELNQDIVIKAVEYFEEYPYELGEYGDYIGVSIMAGMSEYAAKWAITQIGEQS